MWGLGMGMRVGVAKKAGAELLGGSYGKSRNFMVLNGLSEP
jgi:hypothetical protein